MIRFLIELVVVTAVLFGLLLLTTSQLPDPPLREEGPPCSCAGKPEGCYTARFHVHNDDYAFCSMWGDEQSCCMVPDTHNVISQTDFSIEEVEE